MKQCVGEEEKWKPGEPLERAVEVLQPSISSRYICIYMYIYICVCVRALYLDLPSPEPAQEPITADIAVFASLTMPFAALVRTSPLL